MNETKIRLFRFYVSHILKILASFNGVMGSKVICKCGKDAVGFTSDIGGVCSDCLDNKIKEAKKRRAGFMVKNIDSAA